MPGDDADRPSSDRPLELTVEGVRRDSALVHVSGEIDAATAPELEARLQDQINPVGNLRRLVIDLGGVESMTPDGLSVLLGMQRRCFARSVRLCLVNCSPPVVRQLESAGLAESFRRYATVAEATG